MPATSRSTDEDFARALEQWTLACRSQRKSRDIPEKLHAEFIVNRSWHAAGWAALTCGRQALRSGELDPAQHFLVEAYGLFHLMGDHCGCSLVNAHLSAVLTLRGEGDKATKFATASFSSSERFADLDRAIIHNLAASCYWLRGEHHQALAHLISELEFARKMSDAFRYGTVLSNIAAVLLDMNELNHSILASNKALDWQRRHFAMEDFNPAVLTNLLIAHLYSGNLDQAGTCAEELYSLLSKGLDTSHWHWWVGLLDYFGATGDRKRALECYERAQLLNAKHEISALDFNLKTGLASLYEASKDYQLAVASAKATLEDKSCRLNTVGRIGAALTCARSLRALGRLIESNKWQRYARQVGRRGALDRLLITQLQMTLSEHPPQVHLTDKELMCLSLSAHGQSSADIGLKLGITPRTVNFHFGKILKKFNALNRQEAIAKALSANLLPPV